MAESLEPDTVIEPVSLNHDSDLSNGRAEIDTSAPFESVREAATRFGGFGFWKPNKVPEASQENVEEVDIIELKAQAAELQNDLILKESETLEVLKELEATKATVSKLQQRNKAYEEDTLREQVHGQSKPAGLVLKDLNQAKMNLCKIASIRESVEQLKKKLNEERAALEKTRERLMQKSLKVISLEEEEVRVRFAKDGETSEKDLENNALGMLNEVQRLSGEAQEVKKIGENAQSEVVKAMTEIECTRDKIRTAKIRLVAARKMKEAARAAEAVAIAEIEAVTGSKNADKAKAVTISAEEYAVLARSVRDAEEEARKRVEDAMSRVEEANVSKTDVLKKVDEAAQEIETSKRALEEAVERVDAANASKIEAEEALRNWRSSENGQRRRLSSSVNNTSKFKSKRETTRLMDVNGLNLAYDAFEGSSSSSSVPVLKPTMSIGQILSKKLLLAEDSDMNVASERKKMSLGQMLAKNSSSDKIVSKRSDGKENGKWSATRKRKSFGFAKISVLLNKESKNKKKKKKIALN
ncbi:PREDICTED: WEB family protein At2g38370-like [Camelina sativa]|uniref:WEB family protein At2g38370-like n=1 Tax=Camelina sativa TaxID=90675 RepID=A0ABM0Z1P4_CAMSA|nr:PREDICTED: WEB family protein At2g38370-like [Camelina sativa]